TNPPKISTGVFLRPETKGLPLVDFSSEPTTRLFVQSLRPICDTVFNIILVAYVASLNEHRNRAASQNNGEEKSLCVQDDGNKALRISQDAETKRQHESIADADDGPKMQSINFCERLFGLDADCS
ncbi:hypothetical protein EI94DRAFT_1747949, partial [Lactarius quietus]